MEEPQFEQNMFFRLLRIYITSFAAPREAKSAAGSAQHDQREDGAQHRADDQRRVAGAEERSQQAGQRPQSRAYHGDHDSFAHGLSGFVGRLQQRQQSRLFLVRLAGDKNGIARMDQLEAVADFELLLGRVVLQAADVFALALDLAG